MTFYLRQLFIYHNLMVPQDDAQLVALMGVLSMAFAVIVGTVLMTSKDVEYQKFGMAFNLLALLGFAGVLAGIA